MEFCLRHLLCWLLTTCIPCYCSKWGQAHDPLVMVKFWNDQYDISMFNASRLGNSSSSIKHVQSSLTLLPKFIQCQYKCTIEEEMPRWSLYDHHTISRLPVPGHLTAEGSIVFHATASSHVRPQLSHLSTSNFSLTLDSPWQPYPVICPSKS